MLPPSCHLPNSTLTQHGMYNQGYCPHTPCHTLFGPCSKSLTCCLRDWKTRVISLLCFEKSAQKDVTLVLSCRCQECNKKHASVRGYVYSSLRKKPVFLATVIFNNELITFTNHKGHFVFDLPMVAVPTTRSIMLHEPNHHSLEISISLTEATKNDMFLLMERISTVTDISSFNDSVILRLTPSNVNKNNLIAYLHLPGRALVAKAALNDVYTGAGRILYSFTFGSLCYTTPALYRPIYTDTKNIEFIIFSYASGTFSLLNEDGVDLTLLKNGKAVQLDLVIPTPGSIGIEKEMKKLHLFYFDSIKEWWIDQGRMQAATKRNNQYQTVCSIELNRVPLLWTVALPIRTTCYVRILVNTLTDTHITNIHIKLNQSNLVAGNIAFSYYRELIISSGDQRVNCLAAVCTLGGTLIVTDGHNHNYRPVIPNIRYGLLYGSKECLIFYSNDIIEINSDPVSPYYPTLQYCLEASAQHTLGQFIFNSPSSHSLGLGHKSNHLPLSTTRLSGTTRLHDAPRQCHIKVAVLTCAPETQINLQTKDAKDIISSTVTETINLDLGQNHCDKDYIINPLAACLSYPCEDKLVLFANYSFNGIISIPCVPWTHSSSLLYSIESHSLYTVIIQVCSIPL